MLRLSRRQNNKESKKRYVKLINLSKILWYKVQTKSGEIPWLRKRINKWIYK